MGSEVESYCVEWLDAGRQHQQCSFIFSVTESGIFQQDNAIPDKYQSLIDSLATLKFCS